ncbi:glycerol-3-phosphate O-acyltransferase [Irpex rosettiformis]|uniref:Glycerol-3-phosphate O-acyltransferase n=1 Tax=Irpex rosettiformis TaxID=378272 RepID=A0ACB8UH69_9APHY|nr:glycerol-3-phosphate O-acyltransferase [Irpex rosettiformis]
MPSRTAKRLTTTNLTYDGALLFWRTVTNIFFREIRPRGAFNIPNDGPVIFVVAPHHNQFLDPLLLALQVYRETRRQVRFLIAAKSMKRKAVGFFASLMGSIPVVRAADDAKPGTGRVSISDEDPCLVIGYDTKFATEFKPKMQIMLPKSVHSAVAEVVEVISDTRLKIKKEFGGEAGKGTARIREKQKEAEAAGTPGLEFKKLPHVDQGEMYHHVYKCLEDGGCIGIFPEGGSHDRTDLLPLKAGVSLMALGAMANNPGTQVKIVPVGLSYFHPHRFRSRAVVEFGTALDVPPELIEDFKLGGVEKRDAVGKLLDLIYDGLKTVTIRAPDYDTLMVIQAARRLYKTPGQHLTLGQVVDLNKRFLEGYMHFKDEPKVHQLRTDVLKYNRLVRDLGLRDHQIPNARPASWKTLGLLLYRLLLLFIWTVLALPGVILNGPIFLTASIISRKKAKEALAASVVKIAGRDVLATWKILISLGAAPLLYGFYAFLATMVMYRANAPFEWLFWTPIAVIIALPFIGYAALKFGEAGMDVLKSLRPLVVALLPGHQRHLDKVKEMRVKLSNQLVEVINEYGPKIYDDFNEVLIVRGHACIHRMLTPIQFRIMVPSASVPPSTGQPGLWRRKSSVGAVDAQGNLLVHPMTWLDERLFGWTRSAARGTSAWAGAASTEPSRATTPDASDDEEEDQGDYDNLLGYMESRGITSRSKARSKQSSYADLQRLRRTSNAGAHVAAIPPMTPASPITSTASGTDTAEPILDPADGLHKRQGSRTRKASLSDRVPVDRIGGLDPGETFDDATKELNQEIQERKSRENSRPHQA